MTTSKEKALAALLTSKTRKEAAEKAGISYRTIRVYLQDAEFLAEYRQRKGEIIDDAARRLTNAMQKAIDVLENATDGKKVKDAALKASRLVLEYSARFISISDIMARLDAMEEQEKQRADAGDIYL
jgi:molybdenum-dependent DNA-binding transcriptional regulator ModE